MKLYTGLRCRASSTSKARTSPFWYRAISASSVSLCITRVRPRPDPDPWNARAPSCDLALAARAVEGRARLLGYPPDAGPAARAGLPFAHVDAQFLLVFSLPAVWADIVAQGGPTILHRAFQH